MPKNPVIRFNGMNNRVKPHELGLDKCVYALNVMFTDQGELIIPGQEFAEFFDGNVHSVNSSANGILYVSSGTLYKYAGTPVSLKTSIGSNAVAYTRPIGTTVYFANGTVTGRFVKGESSAREWGTPIPTSQPTVAAISTGGMTAGTYRVVTTWIAGEESGASNSVEVDVEEGGGIQLSSFPTPPSYATKIGVYCSHVNGKDLYLYGEYATNTTSVSLLAFKGTIPLDTQFGIPPAPVVSAPMIDHYGRIYWGDDVYLRRTHIGRFGPTYGLTMPFDYLTVLDSAIQTVVSVKGALYVGTLNSLYRITNIDAPDESPADVDPISDAGTVKGSECYDAEDNAYFMSHRGFIKVSEEGLQELSFAEMALPLYTAGSMTYVEYDGLKHLLFSGSGGTANPLAIKAWNDAETFPQTSGWALNLKTLAVSKYDFSAFNRLHNGYASGSGGLSALGAGSVAAGSAKTGRYDFGEARKKRIPDAYLEIDGDKLNLNVVTDNSDIDYPTDATTTRETVSIDLARGANGRYWQFEFSNATGNSAVVSEMELPIIPMQRHR
jgi:hypothetical protein